MLTEMSFVPLNEILAQVFPLIQQKMKRWFLKSRWQIVSREGTLPQG